MQKAHALQALPGLVRFGLLRDLGRTITIAHGGWPGPSVIRRPGGESRPPQLVGAATAVSAYWIARSEPGDDNANGEAPRKQRAIGPQPSPAHSRDGQGSATTLGSDQQCWERECRQCPGFKGTRASANTSGPDSTLTARLLVKLRSRNTGAAPNEENLFLLPDRTLASEPAKENDPTVDLMSRRHPLSSTRTC